MNTTLDYAAPGTGTISAGWASKIKLWLGRIIKATQMDVDTLVESKGWPYLWRR